MAGTRRTGFTDAALVRLLAAWREQPDAGAPTEFTQQLSSWLRWTDAQPLFAALQEPLAVAPPSGEENASVDAALADADSVHTLLARALTEDAPWHTPARPRSRSLSSGWVAGAAVQDELAFDFPTYRRHYVAQQQAMEDRIPPLRARLRRALELRSPGFARLAALDTVMERVLGEAEHRLLAGMPMPLEQRFTRLRANADAAAAEHEGAGGPDAGPRWQTAFQHELQTLLQAELALRWQPIQALLAALRAPCH